MTGYERALLRLECLKHGIENSPQHAEECAAYTYRLLIDNSRWRAEPVENIPEIPEVTRTRPSWWFGK